MLVLGLQHVCLVEGGRAETFRASLPTFTFLVNLCNKCVVIDTDYIMHVVFLPKNVVKGALLLSSPRLIGSGSQIPLAVSLNSCCWAILMGRAQWQP